MYNDYDVKEGNEQHSSLHANWGCLPPTEVNFGLRIRNDTGTEPLVRRAGAVVLELHVIVHEDMSNDDLELVASEETARADVRDERLCTLRIAVLDLPSVLAMAERHVLRRRANELVFDPLALICPHVREPEWVEDARIIVVVVVPVRCSRRGTNHRPSGYHGPIGQRDVDDRLANDGN